MTFKIPINIKKGFINVIVFSSMLSIICCNKKSEVNMKQNSPKSLANDEFQNILSDTNLVTLDSIAKSSNIITYRLLFKYNGKTTNIYQIENQDYSIEFKKKYLFKPLEYVCYEIDDLPTGLVWNILYNFRDKSFYISDKYDIQAIGDTIDRKSVDFIKRKAKVISAQDNNKSYLIKLNRIP